MWCGSEAVSVLVPVAVVAVVAAAPAGIVAVDTIDEAPLETLGRDLQSHPAFDHSVNVGFVELQDPGNVRLRVLERGVGETVACGTGACAAFAALHGRGLVDDEVAVALPGGVPTVRVPDGHLELEGPAEITSVLSSDDPRLAAVPALVADGWGPDPR